MESYSMAYLDEYSLSWCAGEQIRDKSDNTLQNNSNSDSRQTRDFASLVRLAADIEISVVVKCDIV
jgi:hypothetical protein